MCNNCINDNDVDNTIEDPANPYRIVIVGANEINVEINVVRDKIRNK